MDSYNVIANQPVVIDNVSTFCRIGLSLMPEVWMQPKKWWLTNNGFIILILM
jgi:hypothetical protein